MLSLRHRNGEVRFIAWRNRLLELPETPPFVLGHGIDVTEKTDAENKLHSVMRQRESILESVGDGIYGMDMEGKIIFVNHVGARMMGYTQEEMEGKELLQMLGHARADGSVYPDRGQPHLCGEPFERTDSRAGRSFPAQGRTPASGGICGLPDALQRAGDGRGGGVPGRDGAAATGPDEGRVYFDGEPRAAHAADGATCCPGTDRGWGAGEAAGERAQMMDVAIGNCDRLVRLVNDILDFERMGAGRLPMRLQEVEAKICCGGRRICSIRTHRRRALVS